MNQRAKRQLDTTPFQLYPLGDAAVIIQLGHTINPETHRRITALSAYLSEHSFKGFTELVPAYTSVTVYYDPWVVSNKGHVNPYQKVVEILRQRLAKVSLHIDKTSSRVVEIPVCYGGTFGPDLEFVATHSGLTPEEVISIHTSVEYTVYMIGFAPGFPYLGGLSEKIAAPRRQTPRVTIPAGSVGIAGHQTGIYPMETPGGWQLIGRTPLSLFDLSRAEPSLLQAGDLVKFISITPGMYQERKEWQA